jgi:hypothetical protein
MDFEIPKFREKNPSGRWQKSVPKGVLSFVPADFINRVAKVRGLKSR